MNQKRLILGYDGSCSKCTRLAEDAKESFNGRLDILPLSNHQMQGWREEALGENPPWQPTFVEVSDDGVKAWTGARMAPAVAARLGISSLWKLAQILGNQPAGGSGDAAGPSRSAFVKGSAGIVLGAALLLGSKPAAASVKERDPWLEGKTPQEGTGKELTAQDIREELSNRHAMEAFAGLAASQSAEARAIGLNAHDKERKVSRPAETRRDKQGIIGAQHQLSGGGKLHIIASYDGESVSSYQRMTHPDGQDKTRIQVFKLDSEGRAADENGGIVTLVSTIENGSETQVITATSGCSSNGQCGGSACNLCRCQSWNTTCLTNCCGACAASIWWWGAFMSCALIWCNCCVSDLHSSCCTRRACAYRAGKYC